jgi:(+)-abscisic acid 8'-hydroxylase
MSIIKEKQINGEEIGLKWEDTKNMPITSRVIQETLRVASILSFTFREATEDVEYQGNYQILYDTFICLKYK